MLYLAGCAQQPVSRDKASLQANGRETATAAAAARDASSREAADQMLGRAIEAMQQRQFATASDLLHTLTSQTPDGWRGVQLAGNQFLVAYWDRSEMIECSPADSTRTGKDIVWILPSYAKAWYLLAFMALERKDLVEARRDIDQALRLDADHPTLLNEKSLIAQMQGDYDESIALSQQVIGSKRCVTKTALSRAWREQAIAMTEQGRLDDAEHSLHESLKVDPDNPNSLHELDYIAQLRNKHSKMPLGVHRVN